MFGNTTYFPPPFWGLFPHHDPIYVSVSTWAVTYRHSVHHDCPPWILRRVTLPMPGTENSFLGSGELGLRGRGRWNAVGLLRLLCDL